MQEKNRKTRFYDEYEVKELRGKIGTMRRKDQGEIKQETRRIRKSRGGGFVRHVN